MGKLRTLLLGALITLHVSVAIAGPWMYLPDPLRGSVIVADSGSGRVIGHLPTDAPSRNVLVDGTFGRLYVANTDWLTPDTEPGSVTIWNTPSQMSSAEEGGSPEGSFVGQWERTATVAVGVAPMGLALDSSRTTLFVTNAGSETLSIVDVASGRATATFPLKGRPAGAVYFPTSGRLYVARMTERDIAVVDPADGLVLDSIPLDWSPFDLAVVPGGQFIAAAGAVSGAVSIIDVGSRSVERTVDLGIGASGIRLAGGGQPGVVVAVAYTGLACAIDASTGKLLFKVATDARAGSVAVDPATDHVAISTFDRAHVSVFDNDQGTLIKRTPFAFADAGAE